MNYGAITAFLQGYMDKEANASVHKQRFKEWSKPGAKLPKGVTYDKAKNQFRHANGGITSQYGYVGRATPAQAKAAQARKNTPEARKAAMQEKWRTNARKRLNGISISDAQADKLVAQARNHSLAKDDIAGRNAHYDKVFNDFRNSDYAQAQTKAYQNLAKSNMQRTKNKRKELQSLQAYKDNGGRAANTSLADATRPGSDPATYNRMKAYQQQVANAKAYDPIRTSPSRNNWTDTGMVAFDNKHPENRMYNQGKPKAKIKDLSSFINTTSKANAPVPSEAPTVAASSVPTHVEDYRPQPRLLTEPERQQNFYRELSEFPELQDQYLNQTIQNYQNNSDFAPDWTQGWQDGQGQVEAPSLTQLINRTPKQ